MITIILCMLLSGKNDLTIEIQPINRHITNLPLVVSISPNDLMKKRLDAIIKGDSSSVRLSVIGLHSKKPYRLKVYINTPSSQLSTNHKGFVGIINPFGYLVPSNVTLNLTPSIKKLSEDGQFEPKSPIIITFVVEQKNNNDLVQFQKLRLSIKERY